MIEANNKLLSTIYIKIDILWINSALMNYSLYVSSILTRIGKALTMQISSFVPFDRGLDDAGWSDEIDGNDIGGVLPFAIVPIRNVDINFLRHLADTSETIQDYVPRVGC